MGLACYPEILTRMSTIQCWNMIKIQARRFTTSKGQVCVFNILKFIELARGFVCPALFWRSFVLTEVVCKNIYTLWPPVSLSLSLSVHNSSTCDRNLSVEIQQQKLPVVKFPSDFNKSVKIPVLDIFYCFLPDNK